jgi:hypothetical protein
MAIGFFFSQLLIIAYGHSVLTIANGHWLSLLAIVMAIGYWFLLLTIVMTIGYG